MCFSAVVAAAAVTAFVSLAMPFIFPPRSPVISICLDTKSLLTTSEVGVLVTDTELLAADVSEVGVGIGRWAGAGVGGVFVCFFTFAHSEN